MEISDHLNLTLKAIGLKVRAEKQDTRNVLHIEHIGELPPNDAIELFFTKNGRYFGAGHRKPRRADG